MEAKPLEEGNVVRLKSGGPSMTVTRCLPSLNEDWSCDVLYADHNGVVQRDRLPAQFLVLVGA
jgi:predicted glutamine amidotransferase